MKELDFILSNDKVYTSYFARACKILPNRRIISISLSSPLGFEGGFYRPLNPSESLLRWYKAGLITPEQYKEQYYFETLNRLDPEKVYMAVRGRAMCCWETPDKFCHRKIVLDWLKDNLGEDKIGQEI